MVSAVSERVVSVLLVGPADELEPLLPNGVPHVIDRAGSAAAAIARLGAKCYDVVLINDTAEGDVTEEHLAYVRAAHAACPESRFILVVAQTHRLESSRR